MIILNRQNVLGEGLLGRGIGEKELKGIFTLKPIKSFGRNFQNCGCLLDVSFDFPENPL
jgi:hypothetical protein